MGHITSRLKVTRTNTGLSLIVPPPFVHSVPTAATAITSGCNPPGLGLSPTMRPRHDVTGCACRPASDLRSSAAWDLGANIATVTPLGHRPTIARSRGRGITHLGGRGFPPNRPCVGRRPGLCAPISRRSAASPMSSRNASVSRGVGTNGYRRAPHTAVAITRDRATSDPSAPSQVRPVEWRT